jgi:exonuclease III
MAGGARARGLGQSLDSSDLLRKPAPPGRDYGRIYFNVLASRWSVERLAPLAIAFPERYLAARVLQDRDLELHVAHVPPGSTRGLIKVEMLEALHTRLARGSKGRRILCGDFKTPRAERADQSVEFWGAGHAPHTERWNAAERGVILGLADNDLPDVFRTLHGYDPTDASWVSRRGRHEVGRRYDHVFASRALRATACGYLHEWREKGLSDHSAIEVDFAK